MSSNIDNTIQGGFLFTPRNGYEFLKGKPPLHRALWSWMMGEANWKDRDVLKRGQLITSGPAMQEAMSHYVGFRKKTPTADEIRSAYEALVKAGAITVRKAVRGMVITIVDYDLYQTGANYEARRDAPKEDATKPEATPYVTEEVEEREEKDYSAPTRSFEYFWNRYPLKEDEGAAREVWESLSPDRHTSNSIIYELQYHLEVVWIWYPGGTPPPPTATDWLKARPWEYTDEELAEIFRLAVGDDFGFAKFTMKRLERDTSDDLHSSVSAKQDAC
ncbi:MAG TPA: hypothetical protein DCZ75_06425 [Geobacter sp.]|nr:hypothetical protein [Geobacter sp.]